MPASTCVLGLCGIPGAGKTTYSRKLCELLQHNRSLSTNLICVDQHVDSVLAKLDGSQLFDPEAWKAGRAAAHHELQNCLAASSSDLAVSHRLIIFDDTLHYRSMRHECYQLACKHKATYLQVLFRCTATTAQQRNMERSASNRVPTKVLQHIADILEDPTESPHPWERSSTVVVDTNRGSVLVPARSLEMKSGTCIADNEGITTDASFILPVGSETSKWDPDEDRIAAVVGLLWDSIWKLWINAPAAPLAHEEMQQLRLQAQQSTIESRLHQLELACRRGMSDRLGQLEGLSVSQRAALAKRLNSCKRDVLTGARKEEAGRLSKDRSYTNTRAPGEYLLSQVGHSTRSHHYAVDECQHDEEKVGRWFQLFMDMCDDLVPVKQQGQCVEEK